MHLVDSSISSATSIAGIVASCSLLAATFPQAKKAFQEKSVRPLLLASTAFVFVAQMINCPLGLGFSGHLLGGALLTLLLGPYLAAFSLTAILVLQATLLGDGGIAALGLNVLTMALVVPFTTHGILVLLAGSADLSAQKPHGVAIGCAALFSTLAAASVLGIQLGIASGQWEGLLSKIISSHLLIGLFEAGLTYVLWQIVKSAQNGLLFTNRIAGLQPLSGMIALSAIALMLLVPLSSEQPDGLEWTVESMAQNSSQ